VTQWDPTTYLQFADERARPFFDLVNRVRAEQPTNVVDLGCGPGQLTASLPDRWPSATVVGLDSSAAMIAKAEAYAGAQVRFAVQDLRDWSPREPVDVIISNAALQWVPGHRGLLPGLVEALAPGGWLAFQVPGNFTEPSYRLLEELADDERFAAYVTDRDRPASYDPVDYLDDLAGLGCTVDAWETTYLHRLTGPDPVQFEVEYKALLSEAYLARPYGTVLPFRRIFVVAQRPADRS